MEAGTRGQHGPYRILCTDCRVLCTRHMENGTSNVVPLIGRVCLFHYINLFGGKQARFLVAR